MPPDAPFSMRRPTSGRWVMLLVAAGLCRTICAEEPALRPLSAMLDLPREGSLAGRLLDSPAEADGPRKTFLWQVPAFTEPFECAIAGVVGIRFPQPGDGRPPAATGEWRIELTDGGELVGTIEAIDERHVVAVIGPADAPVRLRVRREAVRSLFHGEAGASSFGSGGLAGWQQAPSGSWRDEAGRLASNASGATLFRDLQAGPRTRYDITLSWQERPTLRMAFGVGEAKDSSRGYRLEVRPDGVVAVREENGPEESGGKRADLERCGDLSERGLTVTVFVDQEAGRLLISRFRPLAESVAAAFPSRSSRARPRLSRSVFRRGRAARSASTPTGRARSACATAGRWQRSWRGWSRDRGTWRCVPPPTRWAESHGRFPSTPSRRSCFHRLLPPRKQDRQMNLRPSRGQNCGQPTCVDHD